MTSLTALVIEVPPHQVPVSNTSQEAKLFLNRLIHHPTVCVPEIVDAYSKPRERSLPGTSS